MYTIKKLRGINEISQQKLAEVLGTSKAYVSQLESDEVTDIPLVHAQKMAEFFNCSLIDVYGIDNLKIKPQSRKEVEEMIKIILQNYETTLYEKIEMVDEIKKWVVWE